MVPMVAVLRALSQTGSFWFVLYVIWMFLVLDLVCLIVYNRNTLLEIGSHMQSLVSKNFTIRKLVHMMCDNKDI